MPEHDPAPTVTLILRKQRAQEMIEGRERVIDWQDDDYAVIDGNASIGRIYRTQIPAGDRWMWFLQITGSPANGATDTLDEAKAAIKAAYHRVRGR
jgi:hypothetical protein